MAFVFQAALYCDRCGRDLADQLDAAGTQDDGDSGRYPQFDANPGESDGVDHCANLDTCLDAITLPSGRKIGAWLENDLTDYGVKELVKQLLSSRSEVGDLWAQWYEAGVRSELYGISGLKRYFGRLFPTGLLDDDVLAQAFDDHLSSFSDDDLGRAVADLHSVLPQMIDGIKRTDKLFAQAEKHAAQQVGKRIIVYRDERNRDGPDYKPPYPAVVTATYLYDHDPLKLDLRSHLTVKDNNGEEHRVQGHEYLADPSDPTRVKPKQIDSWSGSLNGLAGVGMWNLRTVRYAAGRKSRVKIPHAPRRFRPAVSMRGFRR